MPRYIRAANSRPLIPADDELALARRRRNHNDLSAAQALIELHLRLVIKIASGYRGYGVPLDRLIG